TCLTLRSIFFFSSRRRHTRSKRDWSSDVCSSDLEYLAGKAEAGDVIRRTALSDLDVVTTGALPDDAANLWMRGSASEAIKRLGQIGRASCRERGDVAVGRGSVGSTVARVGGALV